MMEEKNSPENTKRSVRKIGLKRRRTPEKQQESEAFTITE
jgi:hypothetical protein